MREADTLLADNNPRHSRRPVRRIPDTVPVRHIVAPRTFVLLAVRNPGPGCVVVVVRLREVPGSPLLAFASPVAPDPGWVPFSCLAIPLENLPDRRVYHIVHF